MAHASFKIEQDRLDELDEIIWQQKAAGELHRDTTRSDILRELVEEYVEGNGSTLRMAATAD